MLLASPRCCDHGDDAVEVLGRGTIPETDIYSTACAVQNLWLAARAEGVGVGWVSILHPDRVKAVLNIPESVTLVGYFCMGFVEKFEYEPELEQAGWERRLSLEDVLHSETFDQAWGTIQR